MTAYVSHQNVSLEIEHLIIEELSGKNAVLIHSDFSFSHDDGSILGIGLNVKLESLFLKLFNHGNVGDFEVPKAQFEHFQLPP